MPPLLPKMIDPEAVKDVKPRRKREKAKPLLSIQLRQDHCDKCDGLSGGCLALVICSNPLCQTRFTSQQFNELWEAYDTSCPTCRRSHGTTYVCPACDQPQSVYNNGYVCPYDPGGREVIEALHKELEDERSRGGEDSSHSP